MNAYTDNRALERREHTATIEVSHFNRDCCYKVQTLNYWDEGICFKSEVPVKPGATLLIRANDLHANGACNGSFRGLPSITLAEVKWCKEILNETETFYEIGANYYQPVY